MKKLNILSKYLRIGVSKYHTLILTAVFLGALLTGCSDDLSFRVDTPTTDDNTLTIMIPNVEGAAEYGATRADGYAQTRAGEAEEGTIDNLYLIAYPVTEGNAIDSKREVICQPLNTYTELNVSDAESAYKQYTVPGFQEGGYHIYVLGNLKDYLPSGITINDGLTEGSLRDIVLNFSTDKWLEKGKLPMACLNTEIKTTGNATTGIGGNGIFNFTKNSKIYADLTFLCAKVRYTILFDQNTTGVSNQFSSPDFMVNGVTAKKVRTQTDLVDGAVKAGNSSIDNANIACIASVTYPVAGGTGNEYFSIGSQTTAPADLASHSAWTATDKQKAWQGTVYLPENKLTGTNITSLVFDVTGSEIKADNCHFDLYWENPSPAHGIERGHFYDLVAKIVDPDVSKLILETNVSKWSAEQLTYTLHGPYELIVETTKIEVSSRTPGVLWYRSDVAPTEIRFAYPKITFTDGTTKTVDFYTASVLKNERGHYELTEDGDYQIEVKVNPAIPSSVLTNVQNSTGGFNKTNYMYFEIIAGNLQKKIEVDPLNLEPILIVTPQNITIDVREYVTSGLDSDYIDILVETNVSNSLTISGLSSLTPGSNNNGELTLERGEGATALSTGALTITEGSGNIRVSLKNFFKASDYWETAQTFTFKVIAGSLSEDVTITIKPYTTDYVIHFKSVNTWNDPHIYIYQCLEMPADLSNTNVAGKTVGYGTGKDGNAGLEFLFTNNIAFRGWSGYGGTVNPNESGTYWSGGFVQWGGDSKASYFNPSNKNTDIYNYYADLNSQHDVSKTNCNSCKYYSSPEHFNGKNFSGGDFGSHQFAGTAMIPESDGWYRYTLSGVATPGKAMIMFNNHHSDGQGNGYRYPNTNQVGVPLFDFPDNEGWFLFDGNSDRHELNFYDDKPDIESLKKKYRLYIPSTYNGIYLYDGFSDAQAITGTAHPNNWDTSKSDAKTCDITGWKVVEFYRYTTSGTMKYRFSDPQGGDDRTGGTTSGNFSLIDGYYTGYISSDGAAVTKGKPSAQTPTTTYTYIFYWPTSTGATQLYFESFNGSTQNKYFAWGTNNQGTTNGYYYIEFTTTSLITKITYKLSASQNNNADITQGLSGISTQSDGKYHIYIESAGANSVKSGIPPVQGFKAGEKIKFEWYRGGYGSNWYMYTDIDGWTAHYGTQNGNNATYTVTIPDNKDGMTSFQWNHGNNAGYSTSTVTVNYNDIKGTLNNGEYYISNWD